MQELTIKQKLTNYYCFVIFNSILACIIGIIYWFPGYTAAYLPVPSLSNAFAIVYCFCVHFMLLSILTFIVWMIFTPIIYLKAKQQHIVQTIVSAIFISILFFDTGVFYSDAMHLANIDINTILVNINMDALLKTNKVIAYCCCILAVALIYYVNVIITRNTGFVNNKISQKYISLLLVLTITPILIYIASTEKHKQQLLTYTQRLPFCSIHNNITNRIKNIKDIIAKGEIHYPLKPLQAIKVTNPPNILVIAMDAWRADCFNEIDSPNLYNYAKHGEIFTNHFSGANYTYGSLFGLFYGIPAIYYNLFAQQEQPALFFTRLKQLGYQINCFSTNDQDKCLKQFTNINTLYKLKANTNRQYKQDEKLTTDWLNWYAKLDKTTPWFSFVFYDSLHGPDFPDSYSHKNIPTKNLRSYKKFANQVGKDTFICSYKTCVHYLDSLAAKILQLLKNSNELENTIVIITADHGLESDDNNQGMYGYRSNFTNCQTQVPFAMVLPKRFQQQFTTQKNNLTTHYDIAPTLMNNFLGITNNILDYSIGSDLLNQHNNNNILVTQACQYGSFIWGIVDKNSILRISPNSSYNILNKFNRIIFTNIELTH
jgi:membrane-anchored protein YejM (alkaline phosphatase superfamily)